MALAARTAKRALYRDFYDLTSFFHAHSKPTVTRSRPRCSPISTTTRFITTSSTRHLDLETRHVEQATPTPPLTLPRYGSRQLPISCPGCGAPTQSLHPTDAGFYSTTRAVVKNYLDPRPVEPSQTTRLEDGIVKNALDNIPEDLRQQLGMDALETSLAANSYGLENPTPICDRCHELIHHHAGVPIDHPSLAAIEATIAESTHKYNHVFHVVDAADFPMSLIPSLHKRLDVGWLRGRNRRAKDRHWAGGKSGEMSFIITRSDLLAPKKEQVDSLMPQLREIIRNALGRTGDDKRLGNVRLVSSKRGWWTKEVKTSIWEQGGANWLVGQANVGKSGLFEVVYPKGTNDESPNHDRLKEDARKATKLAAVQAEDLAGTLQSGHDGSQWQPLAEQQTDEYDVSQPFQDMNSLLPPPQPETKYPVMPVVSALPGTTASPIRIPFGNGKGELIDLPGLSRRGLETYVKPEHRLEVVMKRRVAPERIVLKPGSTLIIGGGLLQITPKTQDLIFMVHAFLPPTMHLHVTSTMKARELQDGTRNIDIPSMLSEEKRGCVQSAGIFKLNSNVTKGYAGPLVRKDAAGLKVSDLPFIVWATDILVEGCGWIEVVAQVRKPRRGDSAHASSPSVTPVASTTAITNSKGGGGGFNASWSPMDLVDDDLSATRDSNSWPVSLPLSNETKESDETPHDLPAFTTDSTARTMPEVEIFSPDGKLIGQRPSLSCWLLGAPLETKNTKRTGRPRRSMKGVKKLEKQRARNADMDWS